ncbi:SDR family oxidoreductase [Daejeonella sp. H1SJ63]|uniref:SDR family NAD(P)-dependent oxidoreductase n=1 Tax=Daejeonella sp. H1SJ63 TaxID=3034145 RepID=UPI0023ECE8C0|nr:SDR family oxidoreductase [Daejeonella sp. H1SJ63]
MFGINERVFDPLKLRQTQEMDLELNNKNVVITGGTKGIGLSIAQGFLDEGANVHIISRSPGKALVSKQTKQYPGKGFFYQCDVTDEQSLSACYSEILTNSNNTIDILVSNVGSGKSPLLPINEKRDWELCWNTNFTSSLNAARVFSGSLVKSKGTMIFISSIAGLEFIGAPTEYSIAKAALISFSKTLSHRLAPDVRVNVVAPGNIFVEEGTWGNKMQENPEKVALMLNEKVPLKRFGLPEEVSDLVLFLSSSRAAFITGGCFVIDGGQTISF